jgi:hypothetical protein
MNDERRESPDEVTRLRRQALAEIFALELPFVEDFDPTKHDREIERAHDPFEDQESP